MEPEVFLPSTIIGHVTQYCNHVVSSPDKNNNIKKVCIWKLLTVKVRLSGGQILKVFLSMISKLKEIAYETPVRPLVECALTIWEP